MKKILCLFGIIVILTGCSKKVSNDLIYERIDFMLKINDKNVDCISKKR